MFELRCLVCQNENLAASNADLAKDLRDEVYKMIIEKDWNEVQVKDYLVTRYGDFVLYKPPMKTSTFLLWFGPLLMLLIGFAILFFMVRNNRNQPSTQLDDKARKEMRKLLDTKDKS
jgi:cytochrome c-type biogenesis protein CcmH